MAVFPLDSQLRVSSQEMIYSNFLLRLGNGELTHPLNSFKASLPNEIMLQRDESLIKSVYDTLRPIPSEILAKSAILCPKNKHCYEINETILNEIDSECKVYHSINRIECSDGENSFLPTEFLNSLEFSGLPPHQLKLKKGAVVILLRNSSCNGWLDERHETLRRSSV